MRVYSLKSCRVIKLLSHSRTSGSLRLHLSYLTKALEIFYGACIVAINIAIVCVYAK